MYSLLLALALRLKEEKIRPLLDIFVCLASLYIIYLSTKTTLGTVQVRDGEKREMCNQKKIRTIYIYKQH